MRQVRAVSSFSSHVLGDVAKRRVLTCDDSYADYLVSIGVCVYVGAAPIADKREVEKIEKKPEPAAPTFASQPAQVSRKKTAKRLKGKAK